MKIDCELKVGLFALAVGMVGMQIGLHVNKAIGVGIVFICIFVGCI